MDYSTAHNAIREAGYLFLLHTGQESCVSRNNSHWLLAYVTRLDELEILKLLNTFFYIGANKWFHSVPEFERDTNGYLH